MPFVVPVNSARIAFALLATLFWAVRWDVWMTLRAMTRNAFLAQTALCARGPPGIVTLKPTSAHEDGSWTAARLQAAECVGG